MKPSFKYKGECVDCVKPQEGMRYIAICGKQVCTQCRNIHPKTCEDCYKVNRVQTVRGAVNVVHETSSNWA